MKHFAPGMSCLSFLNKSHFFPAEEYWLCTANSCVLCYLYPGPEVLVSITLNPSFPVFFLVALHLWCLSWTCCLIVARALVHYFPCVPLSGHAPGQSKLPLLRCNGQLICRSHYPWFATLDHMAAKDKAFPAKFVSFSRFTYRQPNEIRQIMRDPTWLTHQCFRSFSFLAKGKAWL